MIPHPRITGARRSITQELLPQTTRHSVHLCQREAAKPVVRATIRRIQGVWYVFLPYCSRVRMHLTFTDALAWANDRITRDRIEPPC